VVASSFSLSFPSPEQEEVSASCRAGLEAGFFFFFPRLDAVFFFKGEAKQALFPPSPSPD